MLLLACCCSCSFQMPRWSLHQQQTEKYVVRCDTKWQHVWYAAHTDSKINLQWKTKLEICHRGKTQNLSLSRNNSSLFLCHFKFRKKTTTTKVEGKSETNSSGLKTQHVWSHITAAVLLQALEATFPELLNWTWNYFHQSLKALWHRIMWMGEWGS